MAGEVVRVPYGRHMATQDRTRWVPAPSAGQPAPSGPGREGGESEHVQERLGRYRLVEEIGEGGMGVVHLALDPRGRAVAIKVLKAHIAHDESARKRLGREVETLSRIRDHRVASVIDADIMGPRPYLVTRYVPGPALDETVEQHGPLTPEALLRLASGTAEAIRAIHACGVVHRDIKPGNVLVEDGEPVLIDFGIAHVQDDVRHTVGGLVMGTPGYLSPELVEGAAITEATDWWGWAATITFAASGRPPFGRGRMDAVLSRVRAGDVDVEGVDPRLVPLLRASLSPDPRLRPHADHVIDALARFAGGHDATVPNPVATTASVAPVRPTQVVAPVRPTQAPAVPAPAPEPQRWAPPAGPPVTARPGPAAYSRSQAPTWEDLPEDEEEGWEEEPDSLVREGDPRIGLPMRSATLGGLGALWLGLLALWPGVAIVSLLLWSTVARAIDRTMTGLVLRRYERGRRQSDVPWAVVSSPWHLGVGVVATFVALVVPALVALAAVFTTALLLSGTSEGGPGPGSPLPLVAGGAALLATLWWGPGGASIRRGTRSIVRRSVPEGTIGQVATGACVGLGLLFALIALSQGEAASWAPFGGSPFSR